MGDPSAERSPTDVSVALQWVLHRTDSKIKKGSSVVGNEISRVTIERFLTRKWTAVYLVTVNTRNGQRWQVSKKYSDFRAFHHQLLAHKDLAEHGRAGGYETTDYEDDTVNDFKFKTNCYSPLKDVKSPFGLPLLGAVMRESRRKSFQG